MTFCEDGQKSSVISHEIGEGQSDEGSELAHVCDADANT